MDRRMKCRSLSMFDWYFMMVIRVVRIMADSRGSWVSRLNDDEW